MYRAIALTFVVLAALLRLHDLGIVVHHSPDEWHYARQAEIVITQGIGGLQAEARRYRADPTLFALPSPARAGYLYLVAAWMRMTGMRGPEAVAAFAALSDLATMALLVWITWRNVGPGQAVVALIFYGASPPVLCMARRGWQESFEACLALCLLFLALETVRSAHVVWPILLGTVAAATIAVKETAFLDACLLLALTSVELARKQPRRQLIALTLSFAFVAAALAAWLSYVLGGPKQVLYFFSETVLVAGRLKYAVDYQSGSALIWIKALWRTDPLLLTVGGIGAGAVLSRPGRRETGSPLLLWCCVLAGVFLLLPLCSPHHLNLRFSYPALAALSILAGRAFLEVAHILPRVVSGQRLLLARCAGALYLLLVPVAGVHEYRSYLETPDLQDLSVVMIMEETG